MKKSPFIIFPVAAAIFASCIKNDVPYPTAEPVIKEFKVEGARNVKINSVSHSIDVLMEESADLRRVKISGISIDPESTVISPDISGTVDMSSPFVLTLTTYDDYEWTVFASANFKRRFNIRGQYGASIIDEDNKSVTVYVPEGTAINNLTVENAVLGPEGITEYTPEISGIHNFTDPVELKVRYHGNDELWTINVLLTTPETVITTLDVWTRIAWIYAAGIEGERMGFRWRRTGDENWTEVPENLISVDGGDFSAGIDGLAPETSYEACAYCGNSVTETLEFRTEEEKQLPNSGFEVYSHAESKNYFSWYDPESQLWNSKWWCSGNAGTTTLGSSAAVCAPDTDDKAEGNASARMNSKYVVIKFAAGNMFSGEFAGIVGLNGGKVHFGRPFTLRPRKLTVSLKYNCGKVDHVGGYPDGAPVKEGDSDRCQVWIALGDWDYETYGGTPESPVLVNTTRKETLFDSTSEAVIAYGVFTGKSSIDNWTDIEIPLEYVSTSRVPTHIIVSCAASMLGDYFTGSTSSVLWVDNMRLSY